VLDFYTAQVLDLLDDPLAQLWTADLTTRYINEARNRVAQESKCLRQVLLPKDYPGQLIFRAFQEQYFYLDFLPVPFNTTVVDVMGITVKVNNERYKLKYWPYTLTDAYLRGWVNYVDWPIVFTRVGGNSFFIAPMPNQDYPCELDIAINPEPLIDDTTVEPIPVPFQEPIQFYACYKAKLKVQAQGEAKYFLDLYDEHLRRCLKAWMQRILPNPYAVSPR
jgi:hypothetical protein